MNQMMKKFLIQIIGGFFIFSPLSALADSVEYHLCKLNSIVRSVRVITSSEERCMVVYTKEGKDQIVGNTSDRAECEEIKTNILRKIKDGKFECVVHMNPSFTFIAGEENESP